LLADIGKGCAPHFRSSVLAGAAKFGDRFKAGDSGLAEFKGRQKTAKRLAAQAHAVPENPVKTPDPSSTPEAHE